MPTQGTGMPIEVNGTAINRDEMMKLILLKSICLEAYYFIKKFLVFSLPATSRNRCIGILCLPAFAVTR